MGMIEINVRDLISPGLIKLASDATMKKALEAGGTVLARAARLSWPEPARRPEPWAPLAASTVRRKGHDKLLYETGHLGDSITLGDVTSREATVGTDAPYSIFHQLGTKRMAARPFIPVDSKGALELTAEVEIRRAMEGVIEAAVT
ncbi:MAG: phage virion morphogenesis protein [Gammaproteobacteria bacterium]